VFFFNFIFLIGFVLVWFWKKFMLLPIVLFSRVSNKLREERVRLVLEDNWSFKLSDFCSKTTVYTRRSHIEAPTRDYQASADDTGKFTKKHLRVYKLCQDPELSKAYSTLTDTNSPVTPSLESLEKLQSKHPQNALLHDGDMAKINAIRDFELPTDPLSKLQVDRELVIELIRKTRVSVKPGLDKLRNRHLKQMVGSKVEADNDEEFEFAERLASIS
jgi:hypothetical protein